MHVNFFYSPIELFKIFVTIFPLTVHLLLKLFKRFRNSHEVNREQLMCDVGY